MSDASAETPSVGQICLDTLRETDRDRYLACLLSPEDKRADLAALYTFNAELARVRDLVHEPLPGEVRMQWWRDLIEGNPHGSSEANPLAAGLLGAVARHRLPVAPLTEMIETRIFDLYDDPVANRVELEAYAGHTASTLIQLASLILDPETAKATAEAAGHAGVAQTVAGLILLMPQHRRRGQLYLPLDILTATGLDRDQFLEGKDLPRISAAIEAFAGLGREHLAKARAAGAIQPSVFPAFLPVSLAAPVLDRAMKAGAGLFEKTLQPPQWRRQMRMALAAFTRRF
ncbi:phytoene/squalene synthase family protein [Rhizobiaceae bacterium BDR2-2]|uniref:Phytoene/squalene synthase family protein n=1 Tax=Ectorhizobium quercum TaxID=2965071 RepID=A0AAE3N2S3_9HYPH|nr:phytoene/squalene synthase family protein [Ectorhizobium quercum]MCX8997577.1 phytoene/squalene synthase family protein [Ectorhizobium quercum]